MNYLILSIFKTSILISIPIILIALLKNKVLCNYTHKLNYIICILITLRMTFIFGIKLYLPFEFFNRANNTTLKKISSINLEAININNYTKIMFYIWIIGALYLAIKSIYKQIIFHSKIQNITYIVTDEVIIKSLQEQKKALNIKKDINVFKVDGLSSLALIGIIKNKIIIPNKDYDNKQLDWIFRHELIHLKRKDNLLKFMLMMASAIHWFNPLINILKEYFNEQCELSCDENIVKVFSKDEIKEYALVLVNTLRDRNTIKVTMLSSQLNTNGIDIIKGRIESMLSAKKRKKGTLAGIIVSLFVGVSLISISNTPTFYVANASSTDLIQENRSIGGVIWN